MSSRCRSSRVRSPLNPANQISTAPKLKPLRPLFPGRRLSQNSVQERVLQGLAGATESSVGSSKSSPPGSNSSGTAVGGISVGDCVVRGPSWNWGEDHDGGPGGYGTVVDVRGLRDLCSLIHRKPISRRSTGSLLAPGGTERHSSGRSCFFFFFLPPRLTMPEKLVRTSMTRREFDGLFFPVCA